MARKRKLRAVMGETEGRRRLMLPTAVSLPVSALMMLLIRLAYLSAPPNFIMASLLSGARLPTSAVSLRPC